MEARPGTTRADANTVARDDRRKIILALIKQKPSLTVKDIAKSISGYSEKTIQRELLAMVAEGILAKKGERRWSAYSLAQ
jgi:DeoR/GlpR family transcriptional regulator of sugar metabolism